MDGAFEIQTQEMKEAMKLNATVRRPIARIMLPPKKHGRPMKKTPRQMQQGINSYFKWCESNDRIPSIKGMMLHLKMVRDAFYRYMDNEEYREIMENARLIISEWIEVDIYNTPGQAAGKITYAKNVIDWTDKLNTVNTNETTITTVLSIDQAKARIASLAHLIDPRLLEDLTSRQSLKQLEPPEEAIIEPVVQPKVRRV